MTQLEVNWNVVEDKSNRDYLQAKTRNPRKLFNRIFYASKKTLKIPAKYLHSARLNLNVALSCLISLNLDGPLKPQNAIGEGQDVSSDGDGKNRYHSEGLGYASNPTTSGAIVT